MVVKLRTFLKLVNIKKIEVTYCPFMRESSQAGHIARCLRSPKILATNSKCQVEVKISPTPCIPAVNAHFEDGDSWEIDVTNIHYNKFWHMIMDKTEFIEGVKLFGIELFDKEYHPKNPSPVGK